MDTCCLKVKIDTWYLKSRGLVLKAWNVRLPENSIREKKFICMNWKIATE